MIEPRLGEHMRHSRWARTLAVLFLLLLAALFCPKITASQSLFIGGRAGVGAGTLIFEDPESSERAGLHVGPRLGGLVGYEINSVLSVQLEMSYASRGWTEGENGAGRRLSYMQMPLVIMLSAPWKTSPHILLGPALSYEVGCDVHGIAELGRVGCDDSRVEWGRHKTQVGMHVGLGIGRPFRGGKLEFQLVGDIGLRNSINETLPHGYNRLVVVMLSASYKIQVGRG
jgi:hypothetical protein